MLKWSYEKIVDFIEKENYQIFECISGVGKETRVKIWCKNPNHKPYEVIFNNFKRGTRCKKCYHESRMKWTDKEIKKFIEDNGYELIEIISGKGIKSKVKIKCPNPNHKPYVINFFGFSIGNRCLECFVDENRISEDEIKSIVKNNGDELVNILEYHSKESKLLLHCDKCNEDYDINFTNYINGGKCNKCSESRGEKKIRRFLECRKIEHISQYRVNECRNKYPLPFDFYIKINNNIILLEYDGLEHFEPIEFYGGKEKFEIRKYNDAIKNNYCEINNIKLIRIPYWDYDNIEEILIKELGIE